MGGANLAHVQSLLEYAMFHTPDGHLGVDKDLHDVPCGRLGLDPK